MVESFILLGGSILDRSRNYFLRMVQTVSGDQLAYHPRVPEVSWPMHEGDYSHQASAPVKGARSYTSTTHALLHVILLNEFEEQFCLASHFMQYIRLFEVRFKQN